MAFEKVLTLPKYHRRTFIGLSLAIAFILGTADYFLLKDSSARLHFLSPYVQALVEAILVGLVVLWLFVLFTPLGEAGGSLEQLQPNQITPAFDSMLREATRWRYKGNFGRYERGKVLPTLASKQNAHATLSIIDPTNRRLCEQHANYRNAIQAIDKGKVYDADTVALEVVVTIVHCAWYVATKKIDIDLHLSSVFDPIRIDANDEAMILTVEDRRSPALKIAKSHFMYESFDAQMKYAREQAIKVDIRGLTPVATVAALDDAHVAQFMGKIGMAQLCTRLTPQTIVLASREARNPYEN